MNEFIDEIFIEKCRAAMFAAIKSGKTKISRSGRSIIFSTPQNGRSDLSTDPEYAAAQLRCAGIDVSAVDGDMMANYCRWWNRVYNERRIGGARFIVTNKFAFADGKYLCLVNRVTLVDGWNSEIASECIRCDEIYDPRRKDRMGQLGAVCHVPAAVKIMEKIAEFREKHPEYANAPLRGGIAEFLGE